MPENFTSVLLPETNRLRRAFFERHRLPARLG
jgi:hypothetical protein